MDYVEKFIEIARRYTKNAGYMLEDGDILRAMGSLAIALDFLRIAKTDPNVRGEDDG